MNGQKLLSIIRRLRTAVGLLACAGALLSGLPAGAQERGGAASEPVQGVVVRGLEIDGSRRIDANAIRAVLVTELGVPVTRARIAEDVRRIYDLGFFRDIRVSARRVPGGQVLTYFVVEQPIIRRVTVIGNENIDSEDLQDQLTLTVGSTIDYPLLIENRARIEGLYQSKGYYLASVAYQIEELAEGSVSVNFEITEGAKVRLREIDFVGNESLDDGDLRRVMQTKQWSWWMSPISHFWDKSGLYAEPIFYQDLDKVTRLYMDRGFIRVSLDDPEVRVEDDDLYVTVQVREGPQFRNGTIDVLGDETMDLELLVGLVETEQGEVFSRSVLSDDVERLRAYYADRGFFDARISPRTDVDPDALTVASTFEVEKGNLFFIDRIEVRGNTRTRDQVVRRELGISEGELYSAEAVRRSEARVRRLGFFEEVTIDARQLDTPRRLALAVEVVERPTGSFSFGAGVGSTDGFLVNGSISQDNLFGQGRAVTASVDMGSNTRNLFLRYLEPYAFGTSATLVGTVSNVEREFVDFDQEVIGFSVNVSYPLDEGDTFLGSGYSFTDREVTGFGQLQAASLLQREDFEGSTSTSLASLSWRRDTRDDIRFPRHGRLSSLFVEFAGLGGLNEFVRAEARTTWYIPWSRWLPFDATVVINTRAGWAIPFNSVSDFDLPACTSTPGSGGVSCADFVAGFGAQADGLSNIDDDLELTLSERYFLGGLGAFQLRGFKQRSVGPRRSVLNARRSAEPFVDPIGTAFAPGDVAFNVAGRTAGGGCALGTGCNSIGDTDDDDFEDLDLADVIGGNKMFLLNLELQFPISEELGLTGIAFLDMGNAFAENDGFNPADLRFGAGLGVNWFSPFGPIMVILGIPLDKLDDEDAAVFEFSMGGSQF
ncbi:MAG: outer membrane protein assembly factor BamA [Myxococcota bacterium]